MNDRQVARELIRLIRVLDQQPGNRVLVLQRVRELEGILNQHLGG